MEKNIIKDKMNELEFYYNNHQLTEYLQGYSEKDLIEIELMVLKNDIEGSYADILDAVRTEREYRGLNKYLSPKTSGFITREYKELTKSISQKEVAESISYLLGLELDYDHLIKWCPLMLSVSNVARIYEYLKEKEMAEDEIIRILCMDSSKAMYLNQLIEDIDKNRDPKETLSNPVFQEFVRKVEKRLIRTKSGSESYRKVISQSIYENQDVLRRLK